MLLYIGLLSGIILIISVFLNTMFVGRVKNQTIGEVEQQGQYALHLILQTIRNAEAINSPAIGASAATLDVDVIQAANDPTVFTSSSGVLQITEGVAPAEDITSNVITSSDLDFINLGRAGTLGTIRVEFTLTYTNPSGRNEYDYAKTFYGTASLRPQ